VPNVRRADGRPPEGSNEVAGVGSERSRSFSDRLLLRHQASCANGMTSQDWSADLWKLAVASYVSRSKDTGPPFSSPLSR
jgi:hypothetical protein